MSEYNLLTEMIKTVANALGDEMLQEVAFVGGCTTGLLLTDELTKENVRYTDDVDLIINVIGKPQWFQFQHLMRKRGFKESIHDVVNCRMRLNELQVDFMPVDEEILGYTNRWYAKGLETAQAYKLTDEITIKLLTPTYFLATKFEAYINRGKNDPLESHDMEDILCLFDGRGELINEIANSDSELRIYIVQKVNELLNHRDIEYAIQSTAKGDEGRVALIFERLEAVNALEEAP